MFFVSTIILGWFILNILINFVETILGISLNDVISIYIIIGYLVMSYYNIKSPLQKFGDNPFKSMTKIDLNLFFQDIYYAMWWPYYIIKKK